MSTIMNRPITGKARLPAEIINRYATSGFYASYFRDLDGNMLNAFCMSES